MGCLTQEMLEHNLIDPTELMQVVSKLHTHYFNAVHVVIMASSPVSFLCLSGGLLHGGVSLPSASRAKREIHLQHHSVSYVSEIQWKVCSKLRRSIVLCKKKKKKPHTTQYFSTLLLLKTFLCSLWPLVMTWRCDHGTDACIILMVTTFRRKMARYRKQ